MIVKITNCTKWTGGGKIPYRMRHRQNITVNIPKWYYDYIINYNNKRGVRIYDYILTQNSKITLL